jgi:hypothetical protein
MKRNFFGAVVSLALFFLTISFFISCNNSGDKEPAAAATNEDSVKKVIARGDYLAHHVALCMDCHSQRDYTQFSGPPKPGTEGIGGDFFNEKIDVPGVVYAKNITPDTVNGIGKWTDDEIVRAITKGISKNGDTLFPLMPYPHYNTMSKDPWLILH